MNAIEDKGLGISTTRSVGELATASTAARAKALVEAKFVIAMHRPRNVMQARTRILESCRRPAFAKGAIYAKPVGTKKMEGLSIRFAETAIQCMTNIDVSSTTVYEDNEKRILNIAVTDLETNTSYGDDITISKTVERKYLKEGQSAISDRINSTGDRVYLVEATEDDLANKIAAAKSKVIRNSGLRLIPQDILEEATEAIKATRQNGGGDPAAETKKIVDAFAAINVSPVELERYLGHPLGTISPNELDDLRSMYSTIKDGEASWNDYVKDKDRFENAKPINSVPPEKPKDKPEPTEPLKTSQDLLSDAVTGAGHTFDQFVKWGKASGNLNEKTEFGSFNEIPTDIARRLMRAPKPMIAALKEVK